MPDPPDPDAARIACPQCDLLQRLPELEAGAAARCPRCDLELWRPRRDALDRTLALALAAAVLYWLAMSRPMLGLSAVGRQASTTVANGARALWSDGQGIVAALVLFAAVIAPALQIACMLAISIAGRRARPRAWVGTLLRCSPATRTWSMLEVMLLGVLIALSKISDYATVIPGMALFALGALIFVLAAMQTCFDPREVWERVEWVVSAQRRRAEEAP